MTAVAKGPIDPPIDPMKVYLREELTRLNQEWEALLKLTPPLPTYTWEDLQEALLDRTSTPSEELLMRGALAAVMKMARFKPMDMVLAEILMLGACSAQVSAAVSAFNEGERHDMT